MNKGQANMKNYPILSSTVLQPSGAHLGDVPSTSRAAVDVG